jgi:hypothetical protein
VFTVGMIVVRISFCVKRWSVNRDFEMARPKTRAFMILGIVAHITYP